MTLSQFLPRLLAQQRDIPTGEIILRLGGAIVALIVLGLVVMALRRRLLGGNDPADAALDMDTLHRQKKDGIISEAEFRSLRRALLGLPAEDAAKSPPGGGDQPPVEGPSEE